MQYILTNLVLKQRNEIIHKTVRHKQKPQKNKMKCKNCDTKFQGNYCFNCGQKKVIERLNIKEIWNSLISSIINYEAGFLRTLFFLTIKPKKIITDYIIGKRKSYFNPIKLLFMVLTIKTFIEINILNNTTKNTNQKQNELISSITESDYFKLLMIIGLIPILSFLSYLFFKKYKYNFTEHILINTYTLSISSVFVIFSYLISNLFGISFTGSIGVVIDLIFFSWVYVNVFAMNKLISFLKAIIILIIGYLLFLIPIITFMKLFYD